MDAPEKEQDAIRTETSKRKDIRGSVTYVYANNSQVTATHTDIRIAFGDLIPTVGVEPRVGVVMSLHHAKAFFRVFSKVLTEVDEQLGGINVMPQEILPLDS